MGYRAAIRVCFRRRVGGAAGFYRQGRQGEFEFCDADHGGLVVIKQGRHHKWAAAITPNEPVNPSANQPIRLTRNDRRETLSTSCTNRNQPTI